MQEPVFVCDFMLGRLGRWLRLLGVKAIVPAQKKGEPLDDDAFIRLAIDNNAVLLTRDRALAQKAANYCQVCLIASSNLEQQAAFILKTFGLNPAAPSQSLCPKCGSVIKEVAKRSVKRLVFPRVYAKQKRFWKCTNKKCGGLYWQGSHWNKMLETGMRIGAELAKSG